MITSVHYTNPAPSQSVRITMQNGAEWHTDAALPPDTEIRRQLHDWIEAGGVIEPFVPPPPAVPTSITPLQARKALRAAGIKPAVDAYLATLGEEEQEEWDYAIEVRRDNATINNGWALLGRSQAELDDLFRLGATL
jgi:hypothetical protein